MGLAHLETGNSAQAAEFFAKGLNLEPEKAKLYLRIAQAYLKKSGDKIRSLYQVPSGIPEFQVKMSATKPEPSFRPSHPSF